MRNYDPEYANALQAYTEAYNECALRQAELDGAELRLDRAAATLAEYESKPGIPRKGSRS